MALAYPDTSTLQKPLRLWPGVLIVVLQWLGRFGLPLVWPDPMAGIIGAFSGLLGGVAIVIWWAFFSRAPRFERWGGVILMIAAIAVTPRFLHVSVATGGMGTMYYFYAIPVLSLAFVVWAVACRHLAAGPRRVAMVATILLACGAWTLLRTGGITGGGGSDFAWRWSGTREERLLAQGGDEPMGLPAVPAAAAAGAGWPGFRGPDRDGSARAARLETDWSGTPPVELWRRPIGPGWSSFAVHGGLVYTQEQRGDEEMVSCYNAMTGDPVWRHRDAARFWESNAGAGPRATPTLKNGRVYTFGATGILNALDAMDGSVVWWRNAAADTGKEVPNWAFASSPLVVGEVVIVAVAGQLAAYDLDTGEVRWSGPDDGMSYSSPHLVTMDGVDQIVLLHGSGATSVAPADGTLLWKHPWTVGGITQPAVTADGDLLIPALSSFMGTGIRRVAVTHGPSGWTSEERWLSPGLKPYFNDFVVHQGHAYGFDGSILSCIDLEDGKRQWKGGRYGNGQLVLLPDQDLLLVLSEQGELALVGATPDQFTELARFPAIEGKTWNHPVLVDNLLLVRNGAEMAAFRLPLAGG